MKSQKEKNTKKGKITMISIILAIFVISSAVGGYLSMIRFEDQPYKNGSANNKSVI